jgi:hypothetical protein
LTLVLATQARLQQSLWGLMVRRKQLLLLQPGRGTGCASRGRFDAWRLVRNPVLHWWRVVLAMLRRLVVVG